MRLRACEINDLKAISEALSVLRNPEETSLHIDSIRKEKLSLKCQKYLNATYNLSGLSIWQ